MIFPESNSFLDRVKAKIHCLLTVSLILFSSFYPFALDSRYDHMIYVTFFKKWDFVSGYILSAFLFGKPRSIDS